ncbi:MAG TPA: AAA family ATPase [Methylomirabilota bacterium]|jgi:poly(3-hydroxybutyrate) depolymerase|nr:AAA family ATPase [Methylomirabilota bacterium]
MAECIILIGLQGAGKTTLYQRRFAHSHAHASMDRFPNARHKAARLAQEITRALDAGQSVVVDNTNPTVAVRAPLIRMARARGAEVIGYYIEATAREAVARNRQREGKARIPDVGIFATAKRLQPPLRAEGFHRLYRARMREDGMFTLEEWIGDMARFREHETADPGWRYRVYSPAEYDTRSEPWPLILFLHGRGESGRDNISQTTVGLGPALVRHPDRWPFVVIFPQKPEPDTQWEAHAAALFGMVDEAAHAYRVDPGRRYLTGVSQGGHGTWELGAERPRTWAALAPVCGYGPPERYARALGGIPIWCFHGERDTVVPIDRSAAIVEAIERDGGGSVRFTSYPDVGHDAWEPAYAEPELPGWLLQQR